MVGRIRGGALARDRFEILLGHGRRPNHSASQRRRSANADVWYTSAAPNGAARYCDTAGGIHRSPDGRPRIYDADERIADDADER